MSTLLLIKNMLIRFFQFMYLGNEEQGEIDTDADVSFLSVLKSMIEIAICVVICFGIFVIPVFLKVL